MKVLVLPNPFNSSCRISVPDGSKVEIFDIRGNLVASHSGGNQFLWHPNNSAPAGIYSVRCTAKNGKISTTKILYVK
ncbi:T9SS type A sorting domain-containing protein [bacterium]|nr:T9SS type A sorting domain-containing protein [bacterium]